MSSADETSTGVRITGQVKWFNNKAGYGFITVNSGEHAKNDIFVHYTAIRVVNSQYKYLVQGEYVEFDLVKSTSDQHEYQAVDISGISGGPLMCESRRSVGGSYESQSQPPRKYKLSGERGPAPERPQLSRQSSTNDNGYTTVQRRRPNHKRSEEHSAEAR